jgi:hypothetical protein
MVETPARRNAVSTNQGNGHATIQLASLQVLAVNDRFDDR